MNTQQQSGFQPGFPSGYCPPGSAIDDCQPVNNNKHTNLMKSFLYTILAFLALCLASYIASAQPQMPQRLLPEPSSPQASPRSLLPEPSSAQQPQPPAKALSLSEALSLARQNNRDIQVAGLDIERTQQEKVIAKSLSLPAAGIGAQASHYFSLPVTFGFGNNGTADKVAYGRYGGKDQLSATLWVTQSLYNPAVKPTRQHAEKSEQQSRQLLRDQQIQVSAEVRQTYLQVLVLGERIRLQKESLSRNQKALQDARSLLAQGRALRVDTLRAFTGVKNLEPDLLRLAYSIEVGLLRLKTLAGIDSLQEIVLSDSLSLPEPGATPTDEEVYAEAVKNRPDLQAMAIQPGIDDQQIRIAAAARKPNVSLVGQYQVQTQANRFDYFNAYYPSTPFVGAQVALPLFSGYANQARIREAKIARLQSVTRYDNAKEQLRAEVRQSVANVLEATSRIQTRTTVKQTAQLSYDITQYRYANGVTSRLELTDAELALTTAQSNYLEAVYDYLAARIQLDRTLGN
jgi:outer membrane protein TolC